MKIHALASIGSALLLGACVTTTEPTGTTTDGVQSTIGGLTDVSSSSSSSSSAKKAFINDRYQAIRYEAAKGEGENVESLAALYGEQDRKQFARWMQANYASLFDGVKEPADLAARIDRARGVNG